jgi:hypothetical protein
LVKETSLLNGDMKWSVKLMFHAPFHISVQQYQSAQVWEVQTAKPQSLSMVVQANLLPEQIFFLFFSVTVPMTA